VPTLDELTDAAVAAAGRWATAVEGVRLLSLTENAVFRVDTAAGGPFVLRLHRPGYNTLRQMYSELDWVESLRAAGIDASTPMRGLDGERYLEVEVGDESRFAGAVGWVGGEPLEEVIARAPESAAERYRLVGDIAARMSFHSQHWELPPGFDRRRWDLQGLVGESPLWGRFWEVPSLDGRQAAVLSEARDALRLMLGALSTDRAHFGLIHADLHLNNVMLDGPRAVVIDFDDAGFGWYLHELGVALHPALGQPWFAQAREALLAGYSHIHALPADIEEQLDIFLTMRCLMIVGWLDARPELEIHAHLPVVVAQAVERAELLLA
jgi:Ser/Thr protein kinase RdoA (MazF antagonist)